MHNNFLLMVVYSLGDWCIQNSNKTIQNDWKFAHLSLLPYRFFRPLRLSIAAHDRYSPFGASPQTKVTHQTKGVKLQREIEILHDHEIILWKSIEIIEPKPPVDPWEHGYLLPVHPFQLPAMPWQRLMLMIRRVISKLQLLSFDCMWQETLTLAGRDFLQTNLSMAQPSLRWATTGSDCGGH